MSATAASLASLCVVEEEERAGCRSNIIGQEASVLKSQRSSYAHPLPHLCFKRWFRELADLSHGRKIECTGGHRRCSRACGGQGDGGFDRLLECCRWLEVKKAIVKHECRCRFCRSIRALTNTLGELVGRHLAIAHLWAALLVAKKSALRGNRRALLDPGRRCR